MRMTATAIIVAAIVVSVSACGGGSEAKPAAPVLPSVDKSVAAMKANTAIWVTDPAGQNIKHTAEKIVTGHGVQLDLRGYGVVSAVTEQTGAKTHAMAPVRGADSQKLVVFTYEAGGQLARTPGNDSDKAAGTVTVVADGTPIPLTAKSLHLNAVTGDGGWQYATAVSVPADAKDIHLEIAGDGVTQ